MRCAECRRTLKRPAADHLGPVCRRRRRAVEDYLAAAASAVTRSTPAASPGQLALTLETR